MKRKPTLENHEEISKMKKNPNVIIKLYSKLLCSFVRMHKKSKPSHCVSNETTKTFISVSNKKELSFYLISNFSKKR